MKRTIFFALIAASCLTSACGKDSDSKKSEPKSTVFHNQVGNGVCYEVVQEELLARGFDVADEMAKGACPEQTTLEGNISVTRYAACPKVDEDGVPFTAVLYSKMISPSAELIDVTMFTQEFICEKIAE